MHALFLCHTPLQALISQHLIRQNVPNTADLLMICYAEVDNAKFRHYFQETAKLCQTAQFITIPQNKWQRLFTYPKLIKNLKKHYHTIYAASIDNPNIQYIISHLSFKQLETFDDGTGNLYCNSPLYRNSYQSKKAKIIRKIQGIHYQTEDLRQLSQCHHTLYPTLPNIASPTIALNLWKHITAPPCQHSHQHHILLGQPIFTAADENIQLFNQLIHYIHQSNVSLHYFPHPREHYQLDHIDYIHTPFIFEDYLGQYLQQHIHTECHIYHLASTAALNVAAFPRTYIHAIQPNHAYFKQGFFPYLYDVMKQMNIPIHTLSVQ